MEIVALRTFLAVIEHGGISHAAEQLHTVQSNVTARIKRLEEELGQSLFLRVGRCLHLSPAGRVLKDYAQEILALERQAINAVSGIGSHSGELLIGCMEAYAALHLPHTLARVKQKHPHIHFQVETAPSNVLVERVQKHQLDCAIVGGNTQHHKLKTDVLLQESLVLLTPKQVTDTSHLPLIVFNEGCVYRERALAWQQRMGNPNVPLMEFGTLDGILGCVAVGLGCTLMPKDVLQYNRYADQLSVHELPDDLAHVSIQLVRYDHSVALEVLDTLRGVMGHCIKAT